MGLKEMREELRELRKSSGHRPISKMKKEDISREIERLKVGREETPAVASVPSSKSRKASPAVESVKKAKEQEFPIAPEKKSKAKKGEAPSEKKKAPPAFLKKKKKVMVEVTDSESE